MNCKSGFTFTNWDKTLSCQPARYCEPTNELQLVKIVEAIRSTSGRMRAFAAGHTWSPLVLSNDTLINLDEFDKVTIDEHDPLIATVQAGIRLKALTKKLSRKGLGMANVGSILEQSIAGATATGTHGTGLRLGNISTQIAGMRVVTGQGGAGQVQDVTAGDTLRALRVNLGALGIVSTIRLKCVPNYDVVFTASVWKLDDVLEAINSLNADNDRVRLYWLAPPLEDKERVIVMTMNSVPPGLAPPAFKSPIDLNQLIFDTKHLMEAIQKAARKTGIQPSSQEPLVRLTCNYAKGLTLPVLPPKHQECEYAVPIGETVAALQTVRELVNTRQYALTLPIEVRFVQADDAMLSPSNGTDVCYIGMNTKDPSIFPAFEHAMKTKHRGRPHWGKHFNLSAKEAEEMYPEYHRFKEIRRELDPDGLFTNQLIHSLFGPV